MTSTGSKPIEAIDRNDRRVRYKTIGEPLGAGSGGTVFLAVRLPDEAEDEEAAADDSRRVAIKMAHIPKWKGYLAEEARLLHSLEKRADEVSASAGGTYRPIRIYSGPTPLKVDDAYGSELIELEYLDGVTLRRWFEESWLRPALQPSDIVDEVLRTGRQLAESLLQIQQGQPSGALIHRDIKPDNIMRTSRGIRLFDFNVARVDSASTKTEHVGTPGYMAPEVLEGGVYDGRADLFSVGVILWEIAHRKRFDLNTNTTRVVGRVNLHWPHASLTSWSDEARAPLNTLLPRLVTDVDQRLRSAEELLTIIAELEAARRSEEPSGDPTSEHDMVSLLAELRPSAMAAVVTDTNGKVPNQALQDFLRERMQVNDPLEDWLLKEVVASSKVKAGPTLFVLAGNAGDGKSHLLARMRKRLASQPDVQKRIHAIADATHALSATDSQRDRLNKFFAPFADANPTSDARVHVIAMNTGMVIRFFEGLDERHRYAQLYTELQRQLGLRRAEADEVALPWRVEVINLDLRDLLAHDAGPSFAERMLERLSPQNRDGIPAAKWNACKQCSAFSLCPVAYNLRALEMPTPRIAVLTTLRRAALEADVHLSPRNMWGFLYRLMTGGIERYDVPSRAPQDGPCDVIRRNVASGDGAWLLRGQFTELLFEQEKAGTPWSGIARHDPAFSSASEIDHLHTRLSIKTELDNAPEIVEKELGGTGQVLAGLSLDALTAMLPREAAFKGRRRDAAVRRQAFFNDATFQAWLNHDGSRVFDGLLDAYQTYSKNRALLTRDQQIHLTQLKDLTKSVFLHGNGKRIRDKGDFLRVSQPNARAETMLLVRADATSLDQVFSLAKILAADVHIVAHAKRPELLALLGYRPTQVTLDVLRVRLTIDLALYDFLRRVNEGQKPSVRHLAQFQSLLFIGERVGNELARQQGTKELFVWDDKANALFRLGTDDFGAAQLTPVEK